MLFFFCLRYSHITFTITHLCLFFIGFYFIFIFFLISLSVSFFWLGFALLCFVQGGELHVARERERQRHRLA